MTTNGLNMSYTLAFAYASDMDSFTEWAAEESPCIYPNSTHDWIRPHSIVGGVPQNPGVYSVGAGLVTTSVCRHCGIAHVHKNHVDTDEGVDESHTLYPGIDPAFLDEAER